MARASELRDQSFEEIEQRLAETKEELFNLRFQNATGQLDNYRQLRALRKDIARMKTILRAIELSRGSAT
ncbi:MAG: 50S ribosomal protein L29 [Actinobacteria bacterium]|nr:50S ribosomal protein L29 [Actinomycetota bacterium]MDQ3533415.1 50S ribosomal protein L29 [Actinomycetota bacterium]